MNFRSCRRPAALILGAAIALLAHSASARELTTIPEARKDIFPQAASFQSETLSLTAEQQEQLSSGADVRLHPTYDRSYTVHRAYNESGDIIGYAFEDTVAGKWGPIHYLLGLTPEGKVKEVIVLEYQEKRGRPVARRRFRNQFEGKTIGDPVRLRRDVHGVSGATISSRGMTDGVRKLLYLFEEIYEM